MHYDLLAKIKNAGMARKESFQTAYSNLNFSLAQVLVKNHYLKDVQKRVSNRKSYLDVKVAYREDAPVLKNFRLVSRPGRRIYMGYKELTAVKQGFGVGILSTPKGIMDIRRARREKVGGEYLVQIW